MRRDVRVYVADILDEMDRIERFISGKDLEALRSDDMAAYAVIRAFEVMGEAAKQVPDAVRARCPDVMWREMAGMRDRLAHAYWGIDLAFAWAAVHERFPIERPALRRLLNELDTEETNDA
jgi:uncharacterized protein with HEPN domain